MLSLFRQAAPRLIYDFDDAVFTRDSFTGWGLHWPGRARSFARVVRAAHAVVAGNRFLHDHASLWTSPEKIHLVPTCLDPRRYSLAEHKNKQRTQLVWIGSSSTLRGMERIQPLLDDLGRRQPGLGLRIICDRFLKLTSLPVIECPWSETSEATDLAAADIGISWLPDDPWSHGKCGLKVLQYMAAGLPVVANPVGMQAELVQDGKTGFIARTSDEWHHAIARLAADPGLRRRMGLAGRAFVEARFNLDHAAKCWVDLLEKVQGRKPVPLSAHDHG
jgi:glycosyltransferase involved in cell wall biosynthesis